MRGRPYPVVVLAAAFLSVQALPAHAYLDPGSGSYFLQILVGGLIGGLVAIGAFWRRIWSFVTRRRSETEGTEPGSDR